MPDEPQTETPRRTGFMAPLQVSEYRRLLTSNAFWWQAMWMEMIVVGWLVLEMTDSAWQVALIGFYRMFPLLIFGFFSGPIVDGLGRRRTMLASQVVNLLVNGAVVALLLSDRLQYWHLAVGALLLGVVWSLDWTARRSILPDLVGRSRTVDAMLVDAFVGNFSRVAGPLLGGAIIDALGPEGCFSTLALLAVASLIVLWTLPQDSPVARSSATDASAWRLMVDGLKYVRHNQPILGVLLITVVMNFLTFPHMALLPVFARDILGQGPVGLGILGGASGVGFFFGLIAVNRVRHSVGGGWLFAAGSALMSAGLVGFAFSTDYHTSVALLVFSGIGQAAFNVMQSSIVLLSASDEMRSRAMGALLLAIGGMPLGRIQIGALAEGFGAPIAVGVMCAVSAVLILAVAGGLPEFRRTRQDEVDAGVDT